LPDILLDRRLDMKTKPTDRRNFLLAAGLGSAGVAAAVVAGKPAATAKPKPEESAASGYRVSEHIEKYYKTTKV
jgi:hypothetical protein